MTGQPQPQPRSLFRDDEPVIQTHPLQPGAVSPQFGRTDCWDFNGVVRRPANQYGGNWRALFHDFDEVWNLRAREMAMIWLNPRHPAVLARGVHLQPMPKNPHTVRMRISHLRGLSGWAASAGLPDDISAWRSHDLHRYVASLTATLAPGSVNEHIVVIKALHAFGRALTHGGLTADPWEGRSARRALGLPVNEELKTPTITPPTWFALVKCAWTYLDVFGPDIIRALERWRKLKAAARPGDAEVGRAKIEAWLRDPATRVPVHYRRPPGASSDISWSLVLWMNGYVPKMSNGILSPAHPGGRRLRAIAEEVARTRSQTGILADLTEVDRPDGSRGPWHPGLHPRALWLECVALRDACYIFVAALSMMRDSEIREITKGSLVEYFGSPAVKSVKSKHDPRLPVRYWWIIEPVGRAIETASCLSLNADLVFASVRPGSPDELFSSNDAIREFVRRVNASRPFTGLDEIPADEHLTAHMFRRTMAMLTRDFPGAEVAVGMQLKHVATRALANRITQGYMATTPAWEEYLNTAIASSRFRRLQDLFDAHSRGEVIGYGPGADRMRETFDAVNTRAAELRASGKARHGDRRVEYDLLRRTRFTIRFGKLNHCTMDDTNPAGAKCLEEAVVPDEHQGPLPDRCQPGRCANSMIGTEHIPIWKAEHGAVTRLLDLPALPAGRRASLQAQLADVDSVLRRTEP